MWKLVGGILVAVVLALGGAVGLVLGNLDTLINQYRSDIESVASEKLNRKVAVGTASSSLSGGLFVQFSGLDLAGPTPDAPALFHVDQVRLKVDLWRAVFSLGKDLQVQEFQLVGPVVRVARSAEGRWDFQDIVDHIAANAAPPTQEDVDKATDPDAYKGLRIAGLAISAGRLEVTDQMKLKRALVVDGITLTVSEIVPGKDATAELHFAIVDGAQRSPFALETQIRPVPPTLDFSVLPQTHTAVSLTDLDLAPWGNLVPDGVVKPAAGKVTITITADTNRGMTDTTAKAGLKVVGLVLEDGGKRGQTSDLTLDLDAGGDLAHVKLDIRRLDVTGPSISLKTRVKTEAPTVAGIRDANVELRVARLERVVGILPPGTVLLPKDLVLEGPFEVDVKGDASGGNLRVDLDKAHVAWADVMDKKAGTPLNLKVTAKRKGDRIVVPSAALVLDTATLAAKADVSTVKGAPLTAELDTGLVDLASLKGVFPPLRKALANKGKVEGSFQLAGKASAVGDQQQAHATLRLKGMDVKLATTTVKGDGMLVADVTPKGDVTTLALDADLDKLDVLQRDEKGIKLVTKQAGFPLGLVFKVVQTPKYAVVEHAALRLGKTRITAAGRADGLDTPAATVAIGVDKLDLAFDDVIAIAPAARQLPKGGHLRCKIAVAGNPNAMDSLSVTVEDLDLTAKKNQIMGRASVQNLDDPLIDVSITKVDLDFDELRKLASSDAIPKGGKLKARADAKGRPKHPETMAINVLDLNTTVYHSNIHGQAHITNLLQPTVNIKLTGDQLDINTLQKETAGAPDKKEAKEERSPASDNPHGLSSSQRAMVKRVGGRVELRVGKVLYDKYVFERVVAIVLARDGVFTFEDLAFTTLGGRFSAGGSQVDAGSEWLATQLKLKLENLDLNKTVGVVSGKSGLVGGKLNLNTTLSARGTKSKDLLKTLQGPVEFNSKEVTLSGFNLMGGVVDQVGRIVPFVKPTGPAAKMVKEPTGLKDLLARIELANGRMVLPKPAVARTPWGDLKLEGNSDFEKRLKLLGTVELTPDAVSRMTGGKVKPPRGVSTPIRIGGTWERPRVEGVDVNAFMKNAGVPDVAGAIKQAADEAQRKMEEETRKAAEEAKRLQKEAEERARQEAARLENEARKRADEARKRAEEEARRRTEEARRAAEDARRRAEQEARKRADEAKRRAEDEARKRADDAKRRAEDEAKRQADEAAKKAKKGLEGLFK